MFLTVVKKEFLENLLSLRFTIACLLCFFVMLGSFMVRKTDYEQVLEDHNKSSAAIKVWFEQVHPWGVLWGNYALNRAPNPLKMFVRGMSRHHRGIVRIQRGQPEMEAGDLRSPAIVLFPAVDLTLFVGLIMSLMAIVFGYDAVCGEKERGTLRLMLSYPLPHDVLLIGKWLGGLVSLIVPYLFAALAMASIVMVESSVALTTAHWLRLLCVFGLSLLYLAAVYTLAMCVSSLTARPATSIMVLVTIWVVLFLAVPNMAPHLAQWWQPTRGVLEMEKERQSALEEAHRRVVEEPRKVYDEKHGFGDRWWRKIDWDNWEERKPAEERWLYVQGLRRAATEEELRVAKKIDEQYRAELGAQVKLSRWLSRLSPFACFSMAASELSGEGAGEEGRFIDQAAKYHAALTDCAHAEILWRINKMIETDGDRKWTRSNTWQNPKPAFKYVPPASFSYLRGALLDAGLLAGLTFVLFMITYARILRYDVR